MSVAIIGDVDSFTFSRGRTLAAAALLLLVLVVAGRYLVPVGAPRSEESAAIDPVAAPVAPVGDVVVHVVGAVRRPGLYRLALGTRIADALRRAGGPTRGADTTLVNLAAPLADGQQVVVPRKQTPGAAGVTSGAQEAAGPVHLNTATLEQLDALPGVGPVTAQKILDYREKHGVFTSVDALDAIPGIGPARIEQLRDLVAP